jgi:hypothetical protein
MKKTKITYWIITSLFAAFMLFTAIPDVLQTPEAMSFITGLGYPAYFVAFIGFAKVLGVIAILIPGYPRIKEWAYAGLTFDLVGATYSIMATSEPTLGWLGMAPPLLFLAASYILYHKVRKTKSTAAEVSVQIA